MKMCLWIAGNTDTDTEAHEIDMRLTWKNEKKG